MDNPPGTVPIPPGATVGVPAPTAAAPHTIASTAEDIGRGLAHSGLRLIGGLDNTSLGRGVNQFFLGKPEAERQAQAYQGLEDRMAPRTTPGKIAELGGDVAQFAMLPEGDGPLLARMATQAAGSGVLSKLQGGSGTAGAILGAAAPAAAEALKAAAPQVMRSALGLRRADYAFGADPAAAAIKYTRGITPGRIAESASNIVDTRTQALNRLADEASRATIRQVPEPLALPPAPASPEPVRLHEAQAVVERPSALQPAGKSAGGYIPPGYGPAAKRTITGRLIPRPQAFVTDTAANLLPPPSFQNQAESAAQQFLDRLDEHGGGGVTYPSGKMPEGGIAHPLAEPLRTTRRAETAQGVWLRTPDGAVVPAQGGGGVRIVAEPRATVSLRPARQTVDDMAAMHSAQNNETALSSVGRVRSQLTSRVGTGEEIPENVTPREALDLKRGVRRQFGKYRTEPQYDHSVASHAAKAASHSLDSGLAETLGPQYSENNSVIHSLLPVMERAESLERGEGALGRTLHRVAAHTGALTGAAVGAGYGARKGGLGGALEYGTLGLLGPELFASPEFGAAGARVLNATPKLIRIPKAIALAGAADATRK